MMESQEEVEEASGDVPRLRGLLADVAERERACLSTLAASFKAGELERAAQLATQLRYIARLRQAIEDKL